VQDELGFEIFGAILILGCMVFGPVVAHDVRPEQWILRDSPAYSLKTGVEKER
jgi:hypothetical protein